MAHLHYVWGHPHIAIKWKTGSPTEANSPKTHGTLPVRSLRALRNNHTTWVSKATFSSVPNWWNIQIYKIRPLLCLTWIPTQISMCLKCLSGQNVLHMRKLTFYCSIHAYIRVLLLLFLADFTPTFQVVASYDSGILIVFVTRRNLEGGIRK